jgi:uncharacterized membrane protein YedE/YeeE
MKVTLQRIAAALACGLTFGFGLTLSGMTDPARVRAFLDIVGNWDPSLLFVLGSAVMVAFVGFRTTLRMAKPLFDDHFHRPPPRRISGRLVLGWALFGIGWGMVGFCPGPAIANLATGMFSVLLFFAAMVAGMALQALISPKTRERTSP